VEAYGQGSSIPTGRVDYKVSVMKVCREGFLDEDRCSCVEASDRLRGVQRRRRRDNYE